MNTTKAELKRLVTHEIGVRVDDALDVARNDRFKLEGRLGAFADAAKALEGVLGAVDKDIEAQVFDPATGQHVKNYVLRCAQLMQSLGQQTGTQRLMQQGKVQAFEHTVALLKNLMEDELRKAQDVAVPPAAVPPPAPTVPARPAGARPPPTIKEQRLAEAAKTAPPALPPASVRRRRRVSRGSDS